MVPSAGTLDLIEATAQRRLPFDEFRLVAAAIFEHLLNEQLALFTEDSDATPDKWGLIEPAPDDLAVGMLGLSHELVLVLCRQAKDSHLEIRGEMGRSPSAGAHSHSRKIVEYEGAVVDPRVLTLQLEGNGPKGLLRNLPTVTRPTIVTIESKYRTSVLPKAANACLQLRRANSIQPTGTRLLEKHAIATSAARLCYAALFSRDDRFEIFQF
jgi:hypothetical protein